MLFVSETSFQYALKLSTLQGIVKLCVYRVGVSFLSLNYRKINIH